MSTTEELLNSGLIYQSKNRFDKKMYIKSATLQLDYARSDIQIVLSLTIISKITTKASLNIGLVDGMGLPIAYGCSDYTNTFFDIEEGENFTQIKSQSLLLSFGKYILNLELVDPGYEFFDCIENAMSFEITSDIFTNKQYSTLQTWGKGSIELLLK
jgi:hypothetical protein